MPTQHVDLFGKLLSQNSIQDRVENNILIGSKRGVFDYKDIISILSSFHNKKILNKYKFTVFTYHKNKKLRILIDLYCTYLRLIKRAYVDISFPTATNPLTYTSIVMSCSHLILQGRGGISTARSYLRYGRGKIAVQSDTPNKLELVDDLNVDVITYNDFDDLSEKIIDNNIDIANNQSIMIKDLESSYKALKALYSK